MADLQHQICACGCGKETIVSKRGVRARFRRGHKTGIGSPPIGKQFARLTVISDSVKRGTHGRRYWVFRCECGTVKHQIASRVVSGETSSCGCLTKEIAGISNRKYLDPLQKWRNSSYSGYRGHARDRNLAFEMTLEEFCELIHRPCAYCGRIDVISNSKRYGAKFPHSGVDRVDSSVGYVAGNVVPCCKTCNAMKQRLSVDEFIAHAELIVKFQRGL